MLAVTISIYSASEPHKSQLEVCFTPTYCDRLLIDNDKLEAPEVEKWVEGRFHVFQDLSRRNLD